VTDLYLIRHGQSMANVTPVVGGMRGDAGLTDLGREQARLLEERLRVEEFGADVLYTSTLPRALQTSEFVARALDLPAIGDDGLQELRPGEADGLTLTEWRAACPPVSFGPVVDPFEPFSPGGESWATFLARAGAALSRLITRHDGERVVAVTHGGVVEASFYLALGLGATSVRTTFAPGNTSITHWQHQHTPTGHRAWTLAGFNDARHLA
jgi:broad specificity phosphatase PhoE